MVSALGRAGGRVPEAHNEFGEVVTMKTRGHVLGCVSTALSIVVVVAGCSDSVTSAPTRQVRPTMSRVADPTVGRHVFVLSGNVPADFADRVAARGGSISSSMSEIG